jgi:serine/threonine-protein kinase RsbW
VAEVQLEIPARVDYLVLARQVVAAAAAIEPRFRDERIDDLRIAVSEATTNAIEAHADLSGDERILIRCNLGEDHIEVQVLDSAGGFDPGETESAPEATAEDRLEWERGLGLPLMQTLADETDISSTAGGTSVRLVVYTPLHPRHA